MGGSGYDGDDFLVKGIPNKTDETKQSKGITHTEGGVSLPSESTRRRLDVRARIEEGDSDFWSPPFEVLERDVCFKNGTEGDMTTTVGSPGSPVYYTAAPGAGQIWYFHALTFYIAESAGLAYEKFGNGSPLTYPLEFEAYIDSTSYPAIYEIYRNPDIGLQFMNGGSTGSQNSFQGEISFSSLSTKLEGDRGDYVRWKVQDDLSSAMYIKSVMKYWEKI